MSEETSQLVSIHDAAGQLGVPSLWLNSRVRSGQLPSTQIDGKTMVDVEQLRQAIATQANQ